MWARVSGARRVIGFDRAHLREPQAAFLLLGNVAQAIGHRPRASRHHVIQKNLSILSALQIAPPPPELPLQPAASPDDGQAIADSRRRRTDTSSSIRARRGRTSAGRPIASARWRPRCGIARDCDSLVTWGPSERALADAVVAVIGGAATAGAGNVGVRSCRADARRRARRFRRHRTAAHRGRDGHAARRLVRTDVAGAQRAMGSEGRSDLARRDAASAITSGSACAARRASTRSRSTRWSPRAERRLRSGRP